MTTPQKTIRPTPVTVHIVNAFIDGERGGNPAGVVLQADGLSTSDKLAIAARVGLSETAFVSASAHETIKLEFFTPTRQIAHCGHATIATFCLLRSLGRIGDGSLSKETIDGPRAVIVNGDQAYMAQSAPQIETIQLETEIGQRLLLAHGLQAWQLAPPFGLHVVSTGNRFLLISLGTEAAVAGVKPDQAALTEVSERLDLIGSYVFSRQTRQPGRAAGTRMFAPRFGIKEEAGTGMAAGPLACLLFTQGAVTSQAIQIEQGYLMQPPSPSVITVRLTVDAHGKITGLLAGGQARVERQIELE